MGPGLVTMTVCVCGNVSPALLTLGQPQVLGMAPQGLVGTGVTLSEPLQQPPALHPSLRGEERDFFFP